MSSVNGCSRRFPTLASLGLHEQLAEVVRRGEAYDLDEIVPESDAEQERHFSVHAFPLGGGMVGVSLDDVTGPSVAARRAAPPGDARRAHRPAQPRAAERPTAAGLARGIRAAPHRWRCS